MGKIKKEKYELEMLYYTEKLGEVLLLLFKEEEAVNILANTLANICSFNEDPKDVFMQIAKKFFLLSKKCDQDKENDLD